MPFWKQSEDPWDRKLEKRPPVSPQEPEETPPAPGVLSALKEQWAQRQAARRDALTLPPEPCPWCGGTMEQGYLAGGRDAVCWYRGIPDLLRGKKNEDTMRLDTEGGILSTYRTTWYCPTCRKMVLDASDVKTRAEESDLFSQRVEQTQQAQNTSEEEE